MNARQSKATTAVNVRLVELITAAIAAKGLTQTDLAEASGVPRGTLAKMLTGRAPVYAEQLIDLADALGADLAEWMQAARAARDDAE